MFSVTFLTLTYSICKCSNFKINVLPCTNWKNANPFKMQGKWSACSHELSRSVLGSYMQLRETIWTNLNRKFETRSQFTLRLSRNVHWVLYMALLCLKTVSSKTQSICTLKTEKRSNTALSTTFLSVVFEVSGDRKRPWQRPGSNSVKTSAWWNVPSSRYLRGVPVFIWKHFKVRWHYTQHGNEKIYLLDILSKYRIF